MSIRKHYTPDFKDLVKTLTENSFQHLNMYKKAEALIGDSNSNALIQRYHSREDDRLILNTMTLENRQLFFKELQHQINNVGCPFNLAFVVAIGYTITSMPEFMEKINEAYAKITPKTIDTVSSNTQ